jgi:hypothetical protein
MTKTKLDFSFVSTHRNRNLWPNPCLFEVPWSGTGQKSGLNAVDAVSTQAPLISWVGDAIDVATMVISVTEQGMVLAVPTPVFLNIPNYYQGALLINTSGFSFRINSSSFIGTAGGMDYIEIKANTTLVSLGDVVEIKSFNISGLTLFVPGGIDLENAYTHSNIYNETRGESALISGYSRESHQIVSIIPPLWLTTDNYSIRKQLPTVGNFPIGAGSTMTLVNIVGIPFQIDPGSFLRVLTTNETVNIVAFNSTTNTVTVNPPLSTSFPASTKIEILSQSYDNYKTLLYSGTSVGQHEQVAYDIKLVSCTIPQMEISNGNGGFPADYPFLYVELVDTNHPTQNITCSNNSINKSYFKVTTPTGQLYNRVENFTKFTGDLSSQTIRFRPTSNFRVAWRFPSGEEIKFIQKDTSSPYEPNSFLQTSVYFNLERN